jgi:hypothetical protein
LRIKRRNVVGDAGQINCSSFSNRIEEEAEGTAARRRPAVPASAVLTHKRASQASSAANETTTTFDLTHKRDKSNIIYQKPIKNRHPYKIKSAFSDIS